jgi:hypothetical protein
MIACRYIRFIGLLWFSILVLVACNAGDMAPSKEPAEPTQSERQGEIQAEDMLGRGAGDYFGYAVAVSGHHALIGQPHDETRGTQAGAAYIFERQGDAWKEVSKLVPDDITADDMFGVTVALDDDIAAIGAPGADDGQGAVYVFERHDREWKQVQRLTISQAQHHDGFASAVALSGNYLFAGAPGDGDAGEQAGAVYVFERQNGLWSVPEVQNCWRITLNLDSIWHKRGHG